MRKILLFLFAVTIVAAWTVPSFAAEVTFDGNYEVRSFTTDNRDYNDDTSDESSWIDQEFNLGVNASANENVSGYVRLKVGDASVGMPEMESRVWGAGASGSGSPTGSSVVMEQAYLNFNAGPASIKTGRQQFSPAGDIFNLVMDMQYDAISFSTNAGVADIYGAFIRNAENDKATGGNDGDDNIYVLGAQFSPNEGVDAGAFVVFQRNRATLDEVYWLGADGSFKAGPVDISAEAVLLTGERDTGVTATTLDYSGYAVAVEASGSVNQIGFGLVAGIASGDDTADTDIETFMGINPSFNVTDIWFDAGDKANGGVGAGSGGNFGGTIAIIPYATFSVNDQLSLGARYAYLMFTEDVAGSGSGQTMANDALGSEIDLNVNYEIVPQLDLTLQAAWFLPDDGVLVTVGKDDTLTEYMARLSYAFGAGSN